MLFNPIFINPQKFLSAPEISGVKKNKLTYLFSDIIKNSLGAKNIDNETANVEPKRVIQKNVTLLKLADQVNPLDSNLNLEEEIRIELANIISAISSENENPETSPKLFISGEDSANEIVTNELSAAAAIAGLIELIKKYDLNVEDGQTAIPKEVLSEITTDKLLTESPELKKILAAVSSGKQLKISMRIGEKNIELQISKSTETIKNSSLMTEETTKPLTVKTENEKIITGTAEQTKSEIATPNTVKDSSLILEKKPANLNTKTTDIKLSNPSVPTFDVKATGETVVKENQVKVEPALFKIAVTHKSVSVSNENIVATGNSNEVTKSENKPANVFVKQIKIQLDDKIVQSDKTINAENPKAKAVSNNEISNQKIITNTDKPIDENGASKLIQSIKKLDNKMLKPDFVPKAIKFSPAAIEEIKNQKFELQNLSSAIRTIKSMSKPVSEFTNSGDVKNISNAYTINKLDASSEKIKLHDDSIELKPAESKNILNVKSGEILTSMKSKASGIEVKELRKFLAGNKNSDLTLRIVEEEKLVKSDTPKSEVTKSINKEQVTELKSAVEENTLKQPFNSVAKFEMDFEKFKAALKEKSVNKEIQKFVDTPKELNKAKLVIETSKPAVIEQTEIKQNSVPKNFSKEIVSDTTIKQAAPVDEKIIKPEIKISETNTNEPQKETKVEVSSAKEQNTNSSENKNSENRQPTNNNYAKTSEVDPVKINTAPIDENFSESLKSAASVNNVETTVSPSSNDILSLPKELTGNVREVKAADIYKELFKLVEKKEKQSITLQLIPKKLGRVKVVVDIIDQMLQTKIEVESESAKQLLQNNMDALKQSLNQSGIQLSSYTISLSNPHGKNFKPFTAKKKDSGHEDLENNETENTPVSGKKLGYNTYEYLA